MIDIEKRLRKNMRVKKIFAIDDAACDRMRSACIDLDAWFKSHSTLLSGIFDVMKVNDGDAMKINCNGQEENARFLFIDTSVLSQNQFDGLAAV